MSLKFLKNKKMPGKSSYFIKLYRLEKNRKKVRMKILTYLTVNFTEALASS